MALKLLTKLTSSPGAPVQDATQVKVIVLGTGLYLHILCSPGSQQIPPVSYEFPVAGHSQLPVTPLRTWLFVHVGTHT